MWLESKVYKEDLEYITNASFLKWDKLTNKTIFITGATGLIGYCLISALLYRNMVFGTNIKIIALVRNPEKAHSMYQAQLKDGCNLHFVIGDVKDCPKIEEKIDYIVHGASPTASAFFVEHPVETIKIAVQGTINMLELAKTKKVEGFVYLSSMEVYGANHTADPIFEIQGTTLDTMSVRSCYPEAKRLCESLCASYASEYQVRANAIRLAQTFGPGVASDDKRVFAEFARCAQEGKNIVLNTAGTSARCYLYNADSVTAILAVLLSDEMGEVFNAANQKTYCSILEMANMVATQIASAPISVCVADNEKEEAKYPPTHMLNLDSSKLEKLGWRAVMDLKNMYLRMIAGGK